MDYHIHALPNHEYEVEHQGITEIVSEAWLLSKIKPKKFEELQEKLYTSVRDNWDFSDLEHIDQKLEETDLNPLIKIPKKDDKLKIQLGNYTVKQSNHPNLFELWKFQEGFHFIAYFFNLNHAEMLIEEDKAWEKYNKKLKRSIHDFDFPKPSQDPNGEEIL